MFNFNHFCKYVHVWINEMFVKNLCNETLSKTNFPLERIKVHLILSYLISNAAAFDYFSDIRTEKAERKFLRKEILWSCYFDRVKIVNSTPL